MSPTPPPSYPADAACAHSDLPPETWDDEVAGETPKQRTSRIATAQTVCRSCPVADACHARRFQGGGVRAGKVHPDRVPGYEGDLFAGFTPERVPAQCGNNAGYKRHRAAQEPACDACKAAHSRHVVEGKQRRRAERVAA